jgi:NAD(P)-dependent dehydrogenase (short-subunit alcohol dehydrogenase family)
MKTVIIFGAYGALGSGVTKTLLMKDYDKFFLADFDAETRKADDNRVTNISSGDLSVEKNVEKVYNKFAIKEGSEVYLFSTVGGYFGGKDIGDTSLEELDRMLNINLRTNFLLAKHYLKRYDNNIGGLCFTTALSGFNPERGKAAYGLSKSALNYLVETLALECNDKKIAVNGIAPWVIDTPENRKWDKDSDYEKWHKPEEIGALIDFIFRAGNIVSGNIISLKIRFRR